MTRNTQRSFGRQSKIAKRKVDDVRLSKTGAQLLVEELFDGTPRNLSEYHVTDTNSGVISITSPGGRRGYAVFHPNGTRPSADYAGNCKRMVETYTTLGRTTEIVVDPSRRVAIVAWAKGASR
jgi:hypothetical protein